MNKTLKIILITLSIPVVLIVIFFVQDYARFAYDSYQGDKQEQMTLDYMAEQEKLAKELEDKYKNDFDGGATPQETWAMFVKALEAGDTDLASKYFLVEKQEEVKNDFSVGKKNGAIPYFLNDFKLIISEAMYSNGQMFEFYTDEIDGGPGFIYTLVLNPYTNIWKIKDL